MMNDSQREDVLSRLRRIEGQIRGIANMVTEKRYCMDILAQTKAAGAAIRKTEEIIMDQHLRTCVAESFAGGDQADKEKKIKEIMEILSRFRKD